MRAPGRWMLPMIALLLGSACSGGVTDDDRAATEQGRAYTAMFYGRVDREEGLQQLADVTGPLFGDPGS